MRIEKSSSTNQMSGCLFKDRYGILTLVAHPKLTKTPPTSKMITRYVCLKLMQWANSVLIIAKNLWRRNHITFSDFVWREPDVLIYQIILEERIQRTGKKCG